MQPRRPLALVAAALLLCVPVLSSCGFNKETDKPYTQANGINYREGTVYVLNAVIAASQADSGTLIASFSNQSESKTATLESVAGGSGNTVTGDDFAPLKIDPMGFVNLADDDAGITVSGSFAAGDVIPLSMTFEDGSIITMDVPVVYACQRYEGLDVSTPSTAPSESTTDASGASAAVPTTGGTKAPPTTAIAPTTDPSTTATTTDAASVTSGASASPSETAEASDTGSPTAYTCGTTGSTGGRN